ncbi:MAG: HEAT repeat domain-containing protein [Cyanobium sp. MAG06]|nr:HEAT repeat domain-containing protein [Cyanobium sp. MAG06]
MIQYIQDENSKEDLYAKLKSVIERGLDNEDVNVRKSSARMIQYIKNDGIKKELIEKGLNNENVNVRKSSARMIQYIQDDNIRKDLIEILKAKG